MTSDPVATWGAITGTMGLKENGPRLGPLQPDVRVAGPLAQNIKVELRMSADKPWFLVTRTSISSVFGARQRAPRANLRQSCPTSTSGESRTSEQRRASCCLTTVRAGPPRCRSHSSLGSGRILVSGSHQLERNSFARGVRTINRTWSDLRDPRHD